MPAIDLTGDWHTLTIQQVGSQVTATATVPNPHFTVGTGTLVGDVLTMTFTGGAVVQTHTGKVTPNGLSIYFGRTTPSGRRGTDRAESGFLRFAA